MTGFRRWAAILLPFVIAARAILLVFQLHDEHKARDHADDPPAWPVRAWETLRFRPGDARVAGWGVAENHPQMLVPQTVRDLQPADPDTGCVLDLAALMRHGGTLTLHSESPPGTWRAGWDGGATVLTRAEAGDTTAMDAATRQADDNLLAAADCGDAARLELTEYQLQVLVDFLAGHPFPARSDPAPPARPVHIHVAGPPPPGWAPKPAP